MNELRAAQEAQKQSKKAKIFSFYLTSQLKISSVNKKLSVLNKVNIYHNEKEIYDDEN